jgi:hypothetical protein
MFPLLIIFVPVARPVGCKCDSLKCPCGFRHDGFLFRVLMLRRKASPTETELRNEYSHMINEALEMIPGDFHREDTSLGITPLASISTDAQTLP